MVHDLGHPFYFYLFRSGFIYLVRSSLSVLTPVRFSSLPTTSSFRSFIGGDRMFKDPGRDDFKRPNLILPYIGGLVRWGSFEWVGGVRVFRRTRREELGLETGPWYLTRDEFRESPRCDRGEVWVRRVGRRRDR